MISGQSNHHTSHVRNTTERPAQTEQTGRTLEWTATATTKASFLPSQSWQSRGRNRYFSGSLLSEPEIVTWLSTAAERHVELWMQAREEHRNQGMTLDNTGFANYKTKALGTWVPRRKKKKKTTQDQKKKKVTFVCVTLRRIPDCRKTRSSKFNLICSHVSLQKIALHFLPLPRNTPYSWWQRWSNQLPIKEVW